MLIGEKPDERITKPMIEVQFSGDIRHQAECGELLALDRVQAARDSSRVEILNREPCSECDDRGDDAAAGADEEIDRSIERVR